MKTLPQILHETELGGRYPVCIMVYRNELRWIAYRAIKALGLLERGRYHSRADCEGSEPRFVLDLTPDEYKELSRAIFTAGRADGWISGFEIYADDMPCDAPTHE